MFSFCRTQKKIITIIVALIISSSSWGNVPVTSRYLSMPVDSYRKPDLKKILMKQYLLWDNVKYKLGGTDHSGIDCSAFVQAVMKEINIHLPRTTHHQIQKGENINQNELKPGDLIFFRTTPETRHVGIYMGGGEFIHSSSSKGVTISKLNNSYWLSRYEKAKRFINAEYLS